MAALKSEFEPNMHNLLDLVMDECVSPSAPENGHPHLHS